MFICCSVFAFPGPLCRQTISCSSYCNDQINDRGVVVVWEMLNWGVWYYLLGKPYQISCGDNYNKFYLFIRCDVIFGNYLVLDLPALSRIAPSHGLTLMTKLSAKLIVWKLISWYSLVMISWGFLHIWMNFNSDLL